MDNVLHSIEWFFVGSFVLAALLNFWLVISNVFVFKKLDTRSKWRRGFWMLCLVFFKMDATFILLLMLFLTSNMQTSTRILSLVGLVLLGLNCFGFGYFAFKKYRENWLKYGVEVHK